MDDLMEKIQKLLLKYEGEFSKKGLSYTVSKKYFEVKTPLRLRHHNTLDIFFRHIAKKRENKNFHHQRNRFHSAVISFYPSVKGILKKNECKEYAFLLYEISRYEEGYAPKERKYKEEKILRKIEKKIKHILKLSEKKNVEVICKETKKDIFRCFFLRPYGYKKTVAGIDLGTFELIFTASFLVMLWIVALVVSFVLK